MSDQPLTRTDVEKMIDERVACRLAQAFAGLNERLADEIAKGVVALPVFHLSDIAAGAVAASAGNERQVSGADDDRIRLIAREEIEASFSPRSDEEAMPA